MTKPPCRHLNTLKISVSTKGKGIVKTYWLISSVHPLRTQPAATTSGSRSPTDKRQMHKTHNVKRRQAPQDYQTKDEDLPVVETAGNDKTKQNKLVFEDKINGQSELTKIVI